MTVRDPNEPNAKRLAPLEHDREAPNQTAY